MRKGLWCAGALTLTLMSGGAAMAVARRERPPCAQRSVPGVTSPPSNTATGGAAIAPRSARGWVAPADLAITTAAPPRGPAGSSHLTLDGRRRCARNERAHQPRERPHQKNCPYQ